MGRANQRFYLDRAEGEPQTKFQLVREHGSLKNHADLQSSVPTEHCNVEMCHVKHNRTE